MSNSLGFVNVDFAFGGEELLFREFSLRFPSGETTAVMGPSGCGKTTLLRLASGLLSPTSGQVVLGQSKMVVTPGVIKGLVFHEDTLLPWLSVEQNLRFHDPRASEVGEEVRRLLAWLGLEGWAHRYPFELSAGMRKRIEFVRALAADKRFLLLDEPFSSLDEPTKLRLWEEWDSRLQRGERTQVLTTHDPTEAVSIAKNVFVLTRRRPVQIQGRVRVGADGESTDTSLERIRKLLYIAAE